MAARRALLVSALGLAFVVPVSGPFPGSAQSAVGAAPVVQPAWLFRPLQGSDEPRFAERQGQVRLRAARPSLSTQRLPRRPKVSGSREYRPPLILPAERAGVRKAVPITRGTELGFRFRPDERESPYGQGGVSGAVSPSATQDSLHSQFRPVQPRRKPTYEELQQAADPADPYGAAERMPQPVMPYPPMIPPGMPGNWNRW